MEWDSYLTGDPNVYSIPKCHEHRAWYHRAGIVGSDSLLQVRIGHWRLQFRQGHCRRPQQGRQRFPLKRFLGIFFNSAKSKQFVLKQQQCHFPTTAQQQWYNNNLKKHQAESPFKIFDKLQFIGNLTPLHTTFLMDFCEIEIGGQPQVGDLNATNKMTIGEIYHTNKHKLDKLSRRQVLRQLLPSSSRVVDISNNCKVDFHSGGNLNTIKITTNKRESRQNWWIQVGASKL